MKPPILADRPVALVTGSTSGIGAAVARRLSRDGLPWCFIRAVPPRQGAGRRTRPRGLRPQTADDAERTRPVGEAQAAWGRLDVPVNNAGISGVICRHGRGHRRGLAGHARGQCGGAVPAGGRGGGRCARPPRGPAGLRGQHQLPRRVRPKGASIPMRRARPHSTIRPGCWPRAGARDPRQRGGARPVDTPLTADWTQAHALWRERARRCGAGPARVYCRDRGHAGVIVLPDRCCRRRPQPDLT